MLPPVVTDILDALQVLLPVVEGTLGITVPASASLGNGMTATQARAILKGA